jgi:hypothetical protein
MLSKSYRSVPANTTAHAPDWQKLQVTRGVIKQWVIFFDPEAANLLHISIEYHGSRILPFSGDRWLTGFFSSTPFEDNIAIPDPPYVLDIYAYNEDDTFPHEYYIHPIIITEEPVEVTAISEGILAKIKSVIPGWS